VIGPTNSNVPATSAGGGVGVIRGVGTGVGVIIGVGVGVGVIIGVGVGVGVAPIQYAGAVPDPSFA